MFQRWLGVLNFTNVNDTVTSELEKIRINAIVKLESQKVSPEYESMRKKLLETIKNLKVRIID